MRGARILLWLLLAVSLAGCASMAAPPVPASNASLDACCQPVQTVPTWVVRAADPVAPLIGNTVARIVWRRGYMDGETQARDEVLGALQPLDILLVANKGRLSNSGLPGYFIHSAVYLGTEAQLRRGGVWNDPRVVPFHAEIAAGRSFVEVNSHGVNLEPASFSLNVDRVLVVRPRGLSASRRREALADFFAELGGRFDFNFDAATPDRLFCIELVERVLPELDLPARVAYGRKVFVSDDLAREAALGHSSVAFVIYIRADRNGWSRRTRGELKRDLADYWNRRRPAPQPVGGGVTNQESAR